MAVPVASGGVGRGGAEDYPTSMVDARVSSAKVIGGPVSGLVLVTVAPWGTVPARSVTGREMIVRAGTPGSWSRTFDGAGRGR